MKYSLANHVLSIEPVDASIRDMFGTISVGGEGSYLDSITISITPSLWDTTGYATGGWVHNKNLSRVGTATISLNQMSDQVSVLKRLCNMFYSADYEGFTLTVTNNEGTKLATCTDCYIQKIPDQQFQASAQTQSWVFTCGKITIE